MGDVLEDIRRVGQATGAEAAADKITAAMQQRIDHVAARTEHVLHKPRVLHLEWVDPLMCGGHWVPEMVEMAGGENCFGDKETGSFKLEWEDVVTSQPEVIILMPCGFDVKRALEDLPLLNEREGWATLPAVQNNRVYAIDAGAYTSRSGPRLVAPPGSRPGNHGPQEMIHPELFSGMLGQAKGVPIWGGFPKPELAGAVRLFGV